MNKSEIKVGQEYAWCDEVDRYGAPAWSFAEVRRVKVLALDDEYQIEVSRWEKKRSRGVVREETFMKGRELWYRYTLKGTKVEFLDKKGDRRDSPKKGATMHVANKNIMMPWSLWEETQQAEEGAKERRAREREEAKQNRIALDQRLQSLGLRNEFGGHYDYTEWEDGSGRIKHAYGIRAIIDLADAVETLLYIANFGYGDAQTRAKSTLASIQADRKDAEDDE